MQAGPSTGLEKREGSANFTVGFYGSLVKRAFFRDSVIREQDSRAIYSNHRKHHQLAPGDLSSTIIISDRMLVEASISSRMDRVEIYRDRKMRIASLALSSLIK